MLQCYPNTYSDMEPIWVNYLPWCDSMLYHADLSMPHMKQTCQWKMKRQQNCFTNDIGQIVINIQQTRSWYCVTSYIYKSSPICHVNVRCQNIVTFCTHCMGYSRQLVLYIDISMLKKHISLVMGWLWISYYCFSFRSTGYNIANIKVNMMLSCVYLPNYYYKINSLFCKWKTCDE